MQEHDAPDMPSRSSCPKRNWLHQISDHTAVMALHRRCDCPANCFRMRNLAYLTQGPEASQLSAARPRG